MATYNFDDIRILKATPEVISAFNFRVFYGANSSFPDGDDNGYPNENLTNLGFPLENYEISIPVPLVDGTVDPPVQVTVSIDTNSNAVTASEDVFTTGFSPVGKLLWDASDVNNLRLIGKIATRVDNNEVTLVDNYTGNDDLVDVDAYFSYGSSIDNNQALEHKDGFVILVKTGITESEEKVIPAFTYMQNHTGAPSISGVVQGLNNTYISLKRISKLGSKASPVTTAVQVPASIQRLNSYVGVVGSNYFSTSDDIPIWVAYLVNPFRDSSKNLDKNTTYVLEIEEVLPVEDDGGLPKGVSVPTPYISATYGMI